MIDVQKVQQLQKRKQELGRRYELEEVREIQKQIVKAEKELCLMVKKYLEENRVIEIKIDDEANLEERSWSSSHEEVTFLIEDLTVEVAFVRMDLSYWKYTVTCEEIYMNNVICCTEKYTAEGQFVRRYAAPGGATKEDRIYFWR